MNGRFPAQRQGKCRIGGDASIAVDSMRGEPRQQQQCLIKRIHVWALLVHLPRTYTFSTSDSNLQKWVGDYNANTSVRPTGPVRIPAYEPSSVSYTKCAYCGEKLTLDLSKYDPREFSEFGVNFNLMYFKNEADKVEHARKAWQRARHRVGIRWSEDDRRHRSESRKAKEKRREEEEVQSPLGWTVRPGSEERVEPGEDEGEDNDAEENDDEWEDDNEPGSPQE